MLLGKHDLYWGAFDYASHVPVLGRVICVCDLMLECVVACIPYSGKFSRGPIFAVFTVDWQTTKIKPTK